VAHSDQGLVGEERGICVGGPAVHGCSCDLPHAISTRSVWFYFFIHLLFIFV
jgi:hypothetical protein